MVGVGNRFRSAVLSGHLLAVLLRDLFALLSGLIPTLLVTIDVAAFLLGNSGALPFSYSVTGLLVPGVALLLLPVLGHWLLHGVAVLLRHVMALFLSLKPAFRFGHVVHLGLRNSVAHLLLCGVALLGVFGFAFLLIPG